MNRIRADEDHFRLFAGNVEHAIAQCGGLPHGQLLARQREQVERLLSLEEEFRLALIDHPWGASVYRDFVSFICDEKRNILAARPFFRERQPVFTSKISKALKKRADRDLYPYHFNYPFVAFVMKAKRWQDNKILGARIVSLANQISEARHELALMNLPLGISRARIFFSRTPLAHLQHMDMVQIATEGLLNGIDKFVGPWSPSFVPMLVQRMVGNLIENYSETLIHFFPRDKRNLYRANKFRGRHGENPDFEKLAADVNQNAKPDYKTTAEEVASLMAAAGTVSADLPVTNGTDDQDGRQITLLSTFTADDETRPDMQMENVEAMARMTEAFQELPLIEQKLLRLRGVAL